MERAEADLQRGQALIDQGEQQVLEGKTMIDTSELRTRTEFPEIAI